jgi:phage major head subunit gpT-like protein
MADVNQAALDFLYKSANNKYQGAFDKAQNWYQDICFVNPVSTRQEIYAWTDRVARFRKWRGARQINGVTTHAQTVTNEIFELTVEISARDVRDNNLNLFGTTATSVGRQSKKWPDVQVADFIRHAASTAVKDGAIGYDGVPFFSASHPINGGDVDGGPAGNQSNLVLNTALSATAIETAVATMESWVGVDGLPLGVSPKVLMVPPQLRATAQRIVEAEFVPNTAGTATQTNVNKGLVKVMVNPELADQPNNWWLLDTEGDVMPFLWQLRMAPDFVFLNKPTDWNVVSTNQFIFASQAEGAAAGTLWFYAYAGTSESAYVHT